MKSFSIILTLALLFSIISCTKQFPQAEYDQAYETLISENYTQAGKQFARLSSNYSVYPEIWYQYGFCCMETGEYNTAIASFNKAAELYEKSIMYNDKAGLRIDALVTIGEVHHLRHDFQNVRISLKNVYLLKMTVI